MRSEEIPEIAAAMAAAGLARLELTGPNFQLTLGRGTSPELRPVEAEAEVQATTPDAEAVAVVSPGVGIFLRAHPLHDGPLVAAGDAVSAGQTIAILQVGALLLPVIAPTAAVAINASVAEATLVGYGDRLFDLLPQD